MWIDCLDSGQTTKTNNNRQLSKQFTWMVYLFLFKWFKFAHNSSIFMFTERPFHRFRCRFLEKWNHFIRFYDAKWKWMRVTRHQRILSQRYVSLCKWQCPKDYCLAALKDCYKILITIMQFVALEFEDMKRFLITEEQSTFKYWPLYRRYEKSIQSKTQKSFE